jgi:hypothetical protein
LGSYEMRPWFPYVILQISLWITFAVSFWFYVWPRSFVQYLGEEGTVHSVSLSKELLQLLGSMLAVTPAPSVLMLLWPQSETINSSTLERRIFGIYLALLMLSTSITFCVIAYFIRMSVSYCIPGLLTLYIIFCGAWAQDTRQN